MATSSLKLVFDENFSHKLIEFVAKESGLVPAVHVRQNGWNGKPDALWMPIAIEADFLIVTGDRNERTRKITTQDFKDLGARVIYFGPFWDHMGCWEKDKWLIWHWERFVAIAGGMRPGEVLLIDKSCHAQTL